jgi:hypothetical protein
MPLSTAAVFGLNRKSIIFITGSPSCPILGSSLSLRRTATVKIESKHGAKRCRTGQPCGCPATIDEKDVLGQQIHFCFMIDLGCNIAAFINNTP